MHDRRVSAEHVQRLNELALDRHPGLCGVETLARERERVGCAIVGTARPVPGGSTTQVWDAEVADEATGRVMARFRCPQLELAARS